MENENDIEIIGITTCGTYPCWVDYTVASFYNHVDKIIVVNSGYDMNNPSAGSIYRLEREHALLKELDINNKITEYTLTQSDINKIFMFTCNYRTDECGRAVNLTYATKMANRLENQPNKKRWILKLDSDQILYQLYINQLINVIKNNPKSTGFRFAQYSDYFNDFEHVPTKELPNNFTDDGALFYKSLPNQSYTLNGLPNTHTHQKEIYNIRTSHMRRIVPPNTDKFEYFFKRFWYHTFGPNFTNISNTKKLTFKEISKIAHDEATSTMNHKGVHINDIPKNEKIPYEPPLVCTMLPLEYIKKGY